jgi:hypothetical protein
VEEAVARYYGGLRLDEDFLAETVPLIEEVMREEQQTIRDLHDGYRKQLRALDVKEERLLDLATDAKLPRDKIHARLRRIQIDRERAEEGLKETGQQLAVGAEVLQTYLRLLEHPAELYQHATEDGRRDLNQAFFERLYLDNHNVVDADLTDTLIEFSTASRRYTELKSAASGGTAVASGPDNARSSGDNRSVVLADVFSALGSSKTNMVGVTGFEPATSSSRTPRSSRLLPCLRWPGRIWMKPNALDSAVVAVLCCCTDRLIPRRRWSIHRGPRAWTWRLCCLYGSGSSGSVWRALLSTLHQLAFQVAFAAVNRVLAVPNERNRPARTDLLSW